MASPTVPFWEEGATVLVSDRVYDVDKEEGKRDFSAWAKKKGASKKDAARITEPVIFEEIMVVSTDSSKTLPGPRDWIVPPFSPSPRPLFAHGSSNRHAKEDEAILKEILGDYPLTPFHTGGTTETESTIVAECIQRFPGQAAALQVSSVGRLFSERSFERVSPIYFHVCPQGRQLMSKTRSTVFTNPKSFRMKPRRLLVARSRRALLPPPGLPKRASMP